MIGSLKDLKGCTIAASDGNFGKVKDAYFDDSEWAVRYIVVDTGTLLPGRKVLISPLFIASVDWDVAQVNVSRTREDVKNSPDIDFDKPVSRQQEEAYYRYYQTYGYWAGPFIWGPITYPAAQLRGREGSEQLPERMRRDDREVGDSHLRSVEEVTGYDIHALDGSIGHVEDLLFDDETWLIESMVVDTRNWLPGKHVMIPPAWIEKVDWPERAAYVKADRESIRAQPEYRDELMRRTRSTTRQPFMSTDSR